MTTAYAPADNSALAADGALPLDEIRSLVDERGRYEGWIGALEARRNATPAHVLERVRQDYAGRLERVAARLAEHVGPLRRHEASLAQAHEAVERRLGDERDGLSEVELRALVGEFGAEEAESRRAAAQHSIDAIERELAASAAQLGDVRALVARVAPTAPAGAQPSAAQPGASDAAPRPTPAAPTPTFAAAPQPTAGAPAAGERDAFDFGAPASGVTTSATEAVGFDHTAVDAARVALGDTERPLTPSFTDAVRSAGGPGVFALGGARAAAEAGAAGQEKTLRCQDCGAMNYPTEWYCEKCGGELAAL